LEASANIQLFLLFAQAADQDIFDYQPGDEPFPLFDISLAKRLRNMPDPKLTIRPEISGLEPASSPAEQFQNQTLRPILKMQNDLLLAIFANYLQRRKVPLLQFAEKKQLDWIEHCLQKDQRLRQLLLGAVVGLFTVEEWETYQSMSAELSRRTLTMLTQRFQNQLSGLSLLLTGADSPKAK
jgi:hypothetical protein